MLVLVILLAVASGFTVAYGTGWFMGPEKAAKLPGGSMMAGVGAAGLWSQSIVFVILCAILGIGGWVTYRVLVAKC